MWQRGLNWVAIALVGCFGVTWTGVVLFADDTSTPWIKVAQTLFGILLTGWAVQKATVMVGRP